MKIVDRRGEVRADETEARPDLPATPPIAPQCSAESPPAPAPLEARARHLQVKTTVFEWVCPGEGCGIPNRIVHMLQPKEAEALGGGGAVGYECPRCKASVRVQVERVVTATLPGLPPGANGRRLGPMLRRS